MHLKTKQLCVFLIILGVVFSFFLIRFQDIINEFYATHTVNIEELRRISNYDGLVCSIANLTGTYCTGEPNSIGGMLLVKPIFELPYPISLFGYQFILILLASIALFLIYLFTDSLLAVMISLFYFPLMSHFEAISVAPSIILLVGSLLCFRKKYYIPAQILAVFLALFRPETIILSIAYAWHIRKLYSLIFIFAYFALWAGSMTFLYGDPLAQLTYNLDNKGEATSFIMIINFTLLTIGYLAALLIFLRSRKEKIINTYFIISLGLSVAYTYFAAIGSVAFSCCFIRIFGTTLFPIVLFAFKDFFSKVTEKSVP
ncbi:MAG: hypothetical protein UT55_C0007G0011 [Candidatus Peregrinibacteria bacterium GW2011_GWE2_39_6]|nr:MAG: hypothetical protein UT36_C0001G0141 [Candidatus Peregrinibacteria bacterium GW2011_GWF2_39_17]KKR26480.1 MAG: hypothetical protein UT55_C0007G0011 [Candidatus Peregrinibacteria bacterium GW2011_GWE2_39_6]HCW32579.1 hypothetical protein [Candidatus Peregrinibacteria bacterium]